MISVRSEVQILPGPPRANARSAFVASRGSGCASNRESGLVQKEAPYKSAAGAASSKVAWCFILRGAALAVARATAVAANSWAAEPPKN